MTTPSTDPADASAAPPTGPSGAVEVSGDPGTTVRWSRRADTTEVELVSTDQETIDAGRITALVATVGAISRNPDLSSSRILLAADHPPDHDHPLPGEVATALGFAPRRELLQLRRLLPVPADHHGRTNAPPLVTRPFRPGHDDAAWLRANNRAFASHPDQGAETPATLATRSSESWFDQAGFLVVDDAEREGELAGFCWTKVHPPAGDDPALGEIYVIGVDPAHQHRGLGRALVLAGLDHLAELGLATATLFVESDNAPARDLYQRLGFIVHERRRVYGP